MTDLVLSVSQAETYDPEQPGGCPRRWWFERVERRERAADSASADDGHAGHALVAGYLRGQALPKRARMLKAVKGALHHLPAPRAGMLVESRFDGQASHGIDGIRIPLNGMRTLWLGGVPWDGYVDLRWRDGDTAVVWDHKFSSDVDTYARPADKLIRTVQMPVYALDSLRLWPDATKFRLVHLYVSRRGVHSFIREQTVTREQTEARGQEIAELVARILETARAKSQNKTEANRKACDAYGGCPHQSVCTAFRRKPMYELTEEEKALFGMVAEVTGEKAKPAEVVKFETPPADETDMRQAAQEADERATVANALAENGNTAEAATLLADVSIPLPQASTPAPQERSGVTAPASEHAKPDTCPSCHPHPAHPGTQCTGKRGRGQCRCDAASAAPVPSARPPEGTAHDPGDHGGTPHDDQPAGYQRVIAGHLPTCVQADGGKWICMDGCTAGQTGGEGVSSSPLRELGTSDGRTGGEPFPAELKRERRTIPEVTAERLDRALSPEPRAALRLEVEFGPRAAAILEKITPALVELLKGR